MKIDRNNYQIWLMDLEEGKLTREQCSALRAFLDENPGLEEEYADTGLFRLRPESNEAFPSADLLKKDISQFPADQFDLLAIAKLENDITPAEEAELIELIETDPSRRSSYELMLKTRLRPVKAAFPGKHKLKHFDMGTRVRRLVYTVTSAAALLLLLFSLYILLRVNEPPPDTPAENTATHLNNSSESRPGNATGDIQDEKTAAAFSRAPEAEAEAVRSPEAVTAANGTGRSDRNTLSMNDANGIGASESKPGNVTDVTIYEAASTRETEAGGFPMRINVENRISITGQAAPEALAVSRIELREYDQYEDRSALGRFIARNFREKILKEETPLESPLKAYEIAEAGVSGINRLLGWEMAISRNTNETGDVSSVYFSSRLLKVNAPVRSENPIP
jgi:hypothetical protein